MPLKKVDSKPFVSREVIKGIVAINLLTLVLDVKLNNCRYTLMTVVTITR